MMCPYCRTDVGANPVRCAICDVEYHADCWEVVGSCVVPGCLSLNIAEPERLPGLVAQTFCTNCGTQAEIGQQFCTNCGTRIETQNSPTTTSSSESDSNSERNLALQLEKLSQLKVSGVLTEKEFKTAKNKVLGLGD
jgi:hypothetical protein